MSANPLQSIRNVLSSYELDAIAFVPGANFTRIFSRDFHLMERPLVVIVPSEGNAVAIVPNLELDSFKQTAFSGEIFDWYDQSGYEEAFNNAAKSLPQLEFAKRFGLEGQRMRAFEAMALQNAFPKAVFEDAHNALSSIRYRKTEREIEFQKRAIQISETALEATLVSVEVGQTEAAIKSKLIQELFASGADGLAFEPIVAAGANAALPHASSRDDYMIKPGDALLIDFGGSYKGYHADITRTFFVKEVSDYDRAFYETVLSANEKGRKVSQAGITAHDVDDAVQEVLENSQFREFALHKTGHGLGLDVHEAPHIMRGNHEVLESGVVFTVEPGLYRAGECGVRIEDDVLVKSDGIECLTNFPRDLRIVG